MRTVSIWQIKQLAYQARGFINKIYLHWTAGGYYQTFSDYHICITGDGAIHVSTDDLTKLLYHTWHRNTGAIGIAICCCRDASAYADGTVDFGSIPPTEAQIETMAKVVAALCDELGIDVNYSNVMTHAEIADIDGYGPASTCERWDLWKLYDTPGDGRLKNGGDVIRGKAIWFQNNSN